jgi:hypothetical protein
MQAVGRPKSPPAEDRSQAVCDRPSMGRAEA